MLPPDLLEEMRAEYLQNLRTRLTRIPSLWREMEHDPEARKEELLRIVHSIAGSAATFGLPEVGEAAFELEEPLQALCRRAGPPEPSERGKIDAGIARLLSVSPAEAGGRAGG